MLVNNRKSILFCIKRAKTNKLKQKNSQLRDMNLFKAPAARAAKTLDRSVFAKTLNAAAASISENRLLSKYRKELEKTQEVLFMERFNPILPDPDPSLASQGRKCIVLSPQIKPACELS